MANINVTLKVSKAAYEEKIAKLQTLLNKLDQTITDYETLRNGMEKFIDGTDDNYEQLRNNVEYNISVVRGERERTQNSIDMLQQTLRDMEEFNTGLGTTVQESAELAKNAVKTGVEIMKIVD